MELLTRPQLYPEPPVLEAADAHRVAAARSALLAAMQARGRYYAIADEIVVDLLTDLRHFCGARRIDFERCAENAAFRFEREIKGGQL